MNLLKSKETNLAYDFLKKYGLNAKGVLEYQNYLNKIDKINPYPLNVVENYISSSNKLAYLNKNDA